MPFQRITGEEIAAKGVVAAPDKLTGTPAENKAIFDRLVRELVASTYNGLTAALEAQTGAAELGATPFPDVPGTSVQGQLQDVADNHARLQEPGGADYVGAAPFTNVAGQTAQQQLREIQANLEHYRAEVARSTGAGLVGATAFNGVPAQTVQGQLQAIQRNVNNINAGIIPQQSVTLEKLGQDVREQLEAPPVPHFSTELDDYTAEVGSFVNTGAGWNTYRFRTPFLGVPVVALQAVGFSGWVEVKQVTESGFLYCLRRPGLTQGAAGSVSSTSLYTANGTGTGPQHAEHTVITAVSLPGQPSLEYETVGEKITLHYVAVEYGGDA